MSLRVVTDGRLLGVIEHSDVTPDENDRAGGPKDSIQHIENAVAVRYKLISSGITAWVSSDGMHRDGIPQGEERCDTPKHKPSLLGASVGRKSQVNHGNVSSDGGNKIELFKIGENTHSLLRMECAQSPNENKISDAAGTARGLRKQNS